MKTRASIWCAPRGGRRARPPPHPRAAGPSAPRRPPTSLEPAALGAAAGGSIDTATLERAVDRAAVRYDRAGDQHYDVISAFIKSIRGSDADAALHSLDRKST